MNKLTLLAVIAIIGGPSSVEDPQPDIVDASTLDGKVLCGYQGWFRCPADGTDQGWVHWSRDHRQLTGDSLTVEMWPDTSELTTEELFPVPMLTMADGRAGNLFSSVHPRTIQRHLEWMRDYGIHGPWLQRFAVDLRGGPAEKRYESNLLVLEHLKRSARSTGRTWAISYDMTDMPARQLLPALRRDWEFIFDRHIKQDPRYLHHQERPVVMVWGFFPDRNLTSREAREIVQFFSDRASGKPYLIGGIPWNWRTNNDPGWADIYRSFDGISPWNVGNWTRNADGTQSATTSFWRDDIAEAGANGMHYLPVLWPGFSWDNLKKLPAGQSTISRRGGNFFWEQFTATARLKHDTAFIAMFDELDEATAIMKVTNSPPTSANFQTLDGLPSDWYLRIAGEGTKLITGGGVISDRIPLKR